MGIVARFQFTNVEGVKMKSSLTVAADHCGFHAMTEDRDADVTNGHRNVRLVPVGESEAAGRNS